MMWTNGKAAPFELQWCLGVDERGVVGVLFHPLVPATSRHRDAGLLQPAKFPAVVAVVLSPVAATNCRPAPNAPRQKVESRRYETRPAFRCHPIRPLFVSATGASFVDAHDDVVGQSILHSKEVHPLPPHLALFEMMM